MDLTAARDFDVVTGAFGYTGKYITQRLLSRGRRVRTLTGHPRRPNPFGDQVSVAPLQFDNRPALVESLRGARTLFNTYWVRFTHGRVSFEQAVANSRVLFQAAHEADVRRIVHLSVANPSEDSPLPYFRGKAVLEKALIDSSMSYAILRPTLIFGKEDILINNIAWFLRRCPAFVIPGAGNYQAQPVFVGDVAELAVAAGGNDENIVLDAVGPEVYTFDELIRLLAEAMHRRPWIVHLQPGLTFQIVRVIGYLLGDVVLTSQEVAALMADLLISRGPPTGRTRLSEWLRENAENVGTAYASELARHFVL